MSRILVTGAAGYLGAAVVADLTAHGHHVVATDRSAIDAAASVERVTGDLLDPVFVEQLFAQPYDLIVHCAAAVPLASDDPGEYNRINVGISRAVARATRPGTFLIAIGSSAVWGRPCGVINRSTPVAPFEAYGRSKLAAERAIAQELDQRSVGYAIIRPRTIVGPGRGGIFAVLLRWIRADLPIPLAGDGSARLSMVGISDLTALIRYIGEQRITGIWPAVSPGVRPLKTEIAALITRERSKSIMVAVPAPLIRLAGWLLARLGRSPFRPWHLGGWSSPEFLIDESWRPEGFRYRDSSADLLDTLALGSATTGASPHRSTLDTPTIDRMLRLARPLLALRRIR